jgi:hypothetical protein
MAGAVMVGADVKITIAEVVLGSLSNIMAGQLKKQTNKQQDNSDPSYN